MQVIEKEALALKKEYGTPRLTSIEQGGDGEINDVDVIANVETLVVSTDTHLLPIYVNRIRFASSYCMFVGD